MKPLLMFASLMLALLILAGGCTSQPAQPAAIPTPAPTTPTQVPLTTPQAVPVTLTSQGWILRWYDDTKGVWSSVIEGSEIDLYFGINGNLSGSAGCTKYYSSTYQTGEPNTIHIYRPTESTTTCQGPTGVVAQDSMYFTDLDWVTSYMITGNQLEMFDQAGRKILQFDRMT